MVQYRSSHQKDARPTASGELLRIQVLFSSRILINEPTASDRKRNLVEQNGRRSAAKLEQSANELETYGILLPRMRRIRAFMLRPEMIARRHCGLPTVISLKASTCCVIHTSLSTVPRLTPLDCRRWEIRSSTSAGWGIRDATRLGGL